MKFIGVAIAALVASGGAYAQDAANGEKVFKKCLQCHVVGANAANKIGPVLNGVIGRPAGTYAGFTYSTAMVEWGKSGKVWDDANLDAYLLNPKGHIPGNKMAFVGLKKDTERADVIAYLKTQK